MCSHFQTDNKKSELEKDTKFSARCQLVISATNSKTCPGATLAETSKRPHIVVFIYLIETKNAYNPLLAPKL